MYQFVLYSEVPLSTHLVISIYSICFVFRNDREDVVECLLADCHVDPNITTKDGSPPLSLTHNTAIIRLLLQHGAKAFDLYKYSSLLPDGSPREAAQSTVSVFMVGDKGAGKSTLTKALTTVKTGTLGRLAGEWIKVIGVKERTAGIECQTVHSSRIGHLSIYDLAGHREFHNAHDTVIRSNISGLSLGLFLFVVNLGALLVDLKGIVSYWLSFIQSQVCGESGRPKAKPYLLAIGSHADTVKSRSELGEKEILVQSFCGDAKNLNFVDYVRVDCRYSESPSLNQLRTLILTTHDKLQTAMPKVSFLDHCLHVYLVSECKDKPGLQLKDLMTTIKSSFSGEAVLPQTMQALDEACSNLSKRGVMLYIQTQTIENSWIIIDKDLLLREVNGSVFAPADFTEYKLLTQTGVVPFSKVPDLFADLIETKKIDSQLIVDFLVHMEFCREIREEDLLKLVTQAHTEYDRDRHFLFPALTQQTPPPDLWQPHPDQYTCCWVLRCLEHHYLSPRFQQVLLLRLAFEHSEAMEHHKVSATSPVLHQQCSLWRNGIKWTTDSSDVLVEISDHRVVLSLSCRADVHNQNKELELVSTRSQVIVQILKAKVEFCASVQTVEEFIPHPQYPVNNSDFSISVEKVAKAICSSRENVQTSPHDLVPVAKLLHFEPYQFCNQQCLVDLYSDRLISCKVTSSFINLSFFKSVSSNVKSLDDFCTTLNVPLPKVAVDSGSNYVDKADGIFQEWQRRSEGTYHCLRQQMDKYSIFSGRNILVYTV